MTEQRYRAVLEVEAGVPVTEVAERFGVSQPSMILNNTVELRISLIHSCCRESLGSGFESRVAHL